VFRPQTAPPGWHEELEKMLVEELSEATAAMEEAAICRTWLRWRAAGVPPRPFTLATLASHCCPPPSAS